MMNTKGSEFIRRIGLLMLFGAGFLLFLFVVKIRSLIHYQGPPSRSLLLSIFLYCAIIGVGLLRLKRWAVILLFLPGILFVLIMVYGIIALKQPLPMPEGLFSISFIVVILGIPAIMLRLWKELNW